MSLESGIHYTQAISPLAGFVDAVDRLAFTEATVFSVVVVVADVACVSPGCSLGDVGVLAADVEGLFKRFHVVVLYIRCLRHAAVAGLAHRGQMGTGWRQRVLQQR